MPYPEDLTNLETYVDTALVSSKTATDTVIFLYKLTSQLITVLNDLSTIKSSTISLSSNKSTSGHQQTMINRLTDIATDINTIVANSDAPSSELIALLQSFIDSITNGDILSNDELLADFETLLTDIQTVITNLESISVNSETSNTNEESILETIESIGAVNSTVSSNLIDVKNLITDITQQTLVTRNNIIITNQLLVNTPVIRNITIPTIDNEVSIVLPAGTRRFSIKNRQDVGDPPQSIIRYAYAPGVAGPATPVGDNGFYTISPYVEDEEYDIHLLNPLTIYFASSTENAQVTVKYWGESPTSTAVPASQIKLSNLSLVNANFEYTFQFPIETKRFTIKLVDPAGAGDTLRVAFVGGIVATGATVDGNSYTLIHSDGELIEGNLGLNSSVNVYIAGTRAGMTVGLEYWV